MRHRILSWRGIEKGWQPLGRPMSKEDARACLQWIERVGSKYSNKLQAMPVELPDFL